MGRARIGVDFDDVVFSFLQSFVAYCNATLRTSHDVSRITTYNLHDWLGTTREQAYDLVDQFYNSPQHRETVPVPDAVEYLTQLSQEADLFLISARPEHTRRAIEEWLELYAPGIFSEIHLTGQFRLGSSAQTKGNIARTLMLDVFIEDSLRQANDISESGVPVVLLSTRWNAGDVHNLTTRVSAWKEAYETIRLYITKRVV